MKKVENLPLPFRSEKVRNLAKRLSPISSRLKLFYPTLKIELKRAGIELDVEDYLSLSLLFSTYNFFLVFFTLLLLFSILKLEEALLFSFLGGLGFGMFSFFYFLSYPKISVRKKVNDLDKNLIFAIRHLLVKVRSGVPLYDAMVGVSEGDYGTVSKEFEKAIKQMQTGVPEAEALDKIAALNPSPYFRRTIWQITNALRSGADIASTLSAIEETAVNEQKIRIANYGAEMNPFAVMYMMLTVIIPTLGITFLIIMSSFMGIIISKWIFYLILFFLCAFQFFFIGVIKSRRPVV
ncbi:MAG: type II secretion system F family protein [Nanoarchaeota archaeon]|nr:type II secretion system F family protein [Nanoarchaeota archaeon]